MKARSKKGKTGIATNTIVKPPNWWTNRLNQKRAKNLQHHNAQKAEEAAYLQALKDRAKQIQPGLVKRKP
jgi:hypothetical protein